jgi:hypothetical protein
MGVLVGHSPRAPIFLALSLQKRQPEQLQDMHK